MVVAKIVRCVLCLLLVGAVILSLHQSIYQLLIYALQK